jgi:hypothetical protein
MDPEAVSTPFRHNLPSPPFNMGVTLLMDATPEQLVFADAWLARLTIRIANDIAYM